MSEKRTMAITDFLTDDEIQQCIKLYNGSRNNTDESFARWCDRTIIAPNIERINRALGQQNDSRYLAYAVEYALMVAPQRGERA